MQIAPNTIWEKPAYLPYVHPKLMPRAVLLAERQLGVKLPLAYLKFLEAQNGGLVRFTFPNSPHSMLWGIGPELPSLLWHWGDEIIPHSRWLPPDVRRLIPFDGGAYSYVCLDYRQCASDDDPAVMLVDFEVAHERNIAPTFENFAARLEPAWNTHTTFGVRGELTAELTAAELGRLMDAPASRRLTHGYECYSFALGEGAWLSISANRVPSVYDTSPYPELLAQVADTGLRFPEYPDITTVLTCTEPALDRLMDLCRRAHIQIVQLRF